MHMLFIFLAVCFFLSGVSSLCYEVLWVRTIADTIGSTPFAVTTVLLVFMGGLGLGAYLGGKYTDRIGERSRLILVYGIVEILVGVYAYLLPFLFRSSRPVFSYFYNFFYQYLLIYSVFVALGCVVLLLVPVTCMGATLPLLCRIYTKSMVRFTVRIGGLYGLNTVGGALGALLCGFWFINQLGLRGSLILAVSINIAIGLLCIWIARRQKRYDGTTNNSKAQRRSPANNERQIDINRAYKTPALIIFGISGFCTLSYEVIWTKLLGLVIAPTSYSFTIILFTFIVGLSTGSFVFGWWADKNQKPFQLLIFSQILGAACALAASQIMGNSQLFFGKLSYHWSDNFGLLHILRALILFTVMTPTTIFLGASFPLVCRICTNRIEQVGGSIGKAYGLNTVGSVAGVITSSFVFVPFFGREWSLSVIIAGQISVSLILSLVLIRKQRTSSVSITPLVFSIVALISCVFFPRWNRELLSRANSYRFGSKIEAIGWIETLTRISDLLKVRPNEQQVFYSDGIGGFVSVWKEVDQIGNRNYSLYISGKADASSHKDMFTQTIAAHFPMLLHREPKRVMVIGLASGVTAAEVLHYPIDRLDVLEINKQVVEASKYFRTVNDDVIGQVKTNLIVQDAKSHLTLTDETYDVIISEPSNPWMAGLADLYTREFSLNARNKLSENGVFVQFLHSYRMNWYTFSLIGRTFASVFPNSLLIRTLPADYEYSGIATDYLLIGMKGNQKIELFDTRDNRKAVGRSRNVSIPNIKVLSRLIESEQLRRLFGKGTVHSQNRPQLEFLAPRLMFAFNSKAIERKIKATRYLSKNTKETIQKLKNDTDAKIDYAAYSFSVFKPFPNMVDSSELDMDQKERYLRLVEKYCEKVAIDNPAFFESKEAVNRCVDARKRVIQQRRLGTRQK